MKNKKEIIVGIIGVIVIIALVVGFAIAYQNAKSSNNTVANNSNSNASSKTSSSSKSKNGNGMTITEGGNYEISGNSESITINTKDDVKLVLKDAEITSEDVPAINVESAGTVTIELSGTNKISSTTTEDLDGAIYSKADLVFSGDGTLEVESNYDGIVSKDSLVIENGTYVINTDDDGVRGKDSVEIKDGTFTINAGGDGIKASNDTDTTLGYVTISGGTFDITAKSDGIQAITKATITGGTFNITSAEGIEGTYVKIDDGTINIEASDDGINASNKSTVSTPTVEINGGDITIKMGQGDTDAIDANGNIYINGGNVNITANFAFDFDGTAEHNGGTLIINGTETDAITNSMMGGGNMKGGMRENAGGEMNCEMKGKMREFPNGERPEMKPEDAPQKSQVSNETV